MLSSILVRLNPHSGVDTSDPNHPGRLIMESEVWKAILEAIVMRVPMLFCVEDRGRYCT